MADHSAIEWTDATWNPVTGCTHVSGTYCDLSQIGVVGGLNRTLGTSVRTRTRRRSWGSVVLASSCLNAGDVRLDATRSTDEPRCSLCGCPAYFRSCGGRPRLEVRAGRAFHWRQDDVRRHTRVHQPLDGRASLRDSSRCSLKCVHLSSLGYVLQSVRLPYVQSSTYHPKYQCRFNYE